MGYKNVMYGSDYPRIEGTFGHTQDTLKGRFDGVSDETLTAHHSGHVLRTVSRCAAHPGRND